MGDFHILLDQHSAEEEALFRLDRWLSYEVRSGWALLILFWMPGGIVMTLLYGLIVVFLPLIAVQLYHARWFKTLAALIVLCALGYVLPRMFEMDPRMIAWVHAAGMFIPFYFFCWVLRWVVAEKVSEVKALKAMARMDKQL